MSPSSQDHRSEERRAPIRQQVERARRAANEARSVAEATRSWAPNHPDTHHDWMALWARGEPEDPTAH